MNDNTKFLTVLTKSKTIFSYPRWHTRAVCGNLVAWPFTHPDYTTLVDPLCCAKRVKNNRFFKPSFPRSEERVVERSKDRVSQPAIGIGADTCPWLRPVQYERIARAAGNAMVKNNDRLFIALVFLNQPKGRKSMQMVFDRLPGLKFPGSLLIK
jgi:hypothetical protein